MSKLIFSLAATLLLSAVAVAAEDAAPPVATGAIPSGYLWYSGGSVAVGIGYTWGHGTLYNSKDQKQYPFKLSGVSVADVGAAGQDHRHRQFRAQSAQHLGDRGFTSSPQRVSPSSAYETSLRSQRQRFQDIQSRTDTAIHVDFQIGAHGLGDLR